MKHKNIMILGTGSNVGKSVVTAGLCRIFVQDGYKTAPFKSQNMALNSFITKDGKEMGRAQVVQAEAAGIEPEVYMNPILLKPTTDRKSQVIVNGKVLKNMDARDYFAFKHNLKDEIMKAYNYIRENFEISVLEGAGSPAEINLKEDDIVNTGMAEMADAPVILIGDIDRGGVFASLYGTVMLLEESERKRIKGIIINKFRGDVSLLEPGIKMLEELIEIPVLGVLPYVKLEIEEEDSLGIKNFNVKKDGKINISVIKLKHISNFTDINALDQYSDLNIKYVTKASELGDEDMIIIPGSKNTIEDMKDLSDKGISEKIARAAKQGTVIFGICGGFQILGAKITDPYNIESNIEEIPGIGLLDIETVMSREKTTTQYTDKLSGTEGILAGGDGLEISGYEIHQGISTGSGEIILGTPEDIKGAVRENIIGTYVHGIFDNGDFTGFLLNKIREMKGLDKVEEYFDFKEFKEQEYNKLADVIRQNLDIEKIYKIMEGE
ncbi:Cobyric acid synthase [Sebaldella termitidis]|uniref:Cobyric acid synthase n=1 Tax=Sebaldella termitidis (strain ATCC 33386 / NCTC 11300) TaxID=526218 RepID=D1AFK1_SEBTE|nr:cobyric acid synthase CobQ [Sebaldella termitidis ATCC 33386]SUI23187.1 Cobyric acid synthase [Sebaldella termitidis]